MTPARSAWALAALAAALAGCGRSEAPKADVNDRAASGLDAADKMSK